MTILIRSNDSMILFQHPEWHQHIFEVDFRVEKLGALVSKTSVDGVDKPLGNLHLEGFSLSFALAKYDMKVDINLRCGFFSAQFDCL